MNLIQASILNNFCEDNSEVLLVFAQAFGSLSVYYRNKYGNIAHKFKSCNRAKELEPGQVWVSLQNFDDSYKELLKYFHPDTYKGKRLNDELTVCISSIIRIKEARKTISMRELNGIISQLDTRPVHKLSHYRDSLPNFEKSLCGKRWVCRLKDWVESFGWFQDSLYNGSSLKYI